MSSCTKLFAGILLCCTLPAQPVRAQANPVRAGSGHPLEIAVTYAAAHANRTVTGADFWLQGGALELGAPIFRGLGLKASLTGLHKASNQPTVASLDMITLCFGPTYTAHLGQRVSVFGEGLVGEANGFHSVFTLGSGPVSAPNVGTTDSANVLAVQTGGGVDLALTRRFAVRLAQVDYLRTQFPNGYSNIQNNLRVAGGVVLRFH